MIPSPWVSLVLVLATHRLVRFVGWDHLPPLVRTRSWVTGEYTTTRGSANSRLGLTSERVEVEVAHRREFFNELFACSFCLSAWIAVPVYAFWFFWPWWTVTLLAAPALSSAVGILSRWLDP